MHLFEPWFVNKLRLQELIAGWKINIDICSRQLELKPASVTDQPNLHSALHNKNYEMGDCWLPTLPIPLDLIRNLFSKIFVKIQMQAYVSAWNLKLKEYIYKSASTLVICCVPRHLTTPLLWESHDAVWKKKLIKTAKWKQQFHTFSNMIESAWFAKWLFRLART